MTGTFRAVGAAVFAGWVALAPAPAAQAQPSVEEAEKAIKEGGRRILRALEALMMSIPQYETPEVLENGDIIIRRKRRDPSETPPAEPGEPTAPGEPGEDETAT